MRVGALFHCRLVLLHASRAEITCRSLVSPRKDWQYASSTYCRRYHYTATLRTNHEKAVFVVDLNNIKNDNANQAELVKETSR